MPQYVLELDIHMVMQSNISHACGSEHLILQGPTHHLFEDIRKQESWVGLENGLSDEENRELAASHRPSEIAALISLGLGKRFMKVGA